MLILVTVSGVSVFVLLQSVTGEGLSGIGGAERPAAFVVPDSNAPAPCKMVPESITVRYSANP